MPGMLAKLPYLPDMREAGAPAAINRIYADIKNASGTPLVNLIYRHLATIPGGLEWVDILPTIKYLLGIVRSLRHVISEQLCNRRWLRHFGLFCANISSHCAAFDFPLTSIRPPP
jgi:hypothetical protein